MDSTAKLIITQTSEQCKSYQLYLSGRVVWSNRVYPTDEGHEGAIARMSAYARKHRLWVEDHTGKVLVGQDEGEAA